MSSAVVASQADTVVWVISLNWTAVGDDGMVGTASAYDVRYSLDSITEANWNAASQATGEPAPHPAFSLDSFTIVGLLPDTPYYVAIKARDEAYNWSSISNIVRKNSTIFLGADVGGDTDPILPGTSQLSPNYPNPFNPTTTINFSLPRTMRVSLDVINALGQRVATLLDGSLLSAGEHTVIWNGHLKSGHTASSGVYFYRLAAEDRTHVRSMTLLK